MFTSFHFKVSSFDIITLLHPVFLLPVIVTIVIILISSAYLKWWYDMIWYDLFIERGGFSFPFSSFWSIFLPPSVWASTYTWHMSHNEIPPLSAALMCFFKYISFHTNIILNIFFSSMEQEKLEKNSSLFKYSTHIIKKNILPLFLVVSSVCLCKLYYTLHSEKSKYYDLQ